MLLLHQQNTVRALATVREHLRLFRGVPMAGAPLEFRASHWGWVARQYAVMADLLSKRLPPEAGLPPEVILLCITPSDDSWLVVAAC